MKTTQIKILFTVLLFSVAASSVMQADTAEVAEKWYFHREAMKRWHYHEFGEVLDEE